MNMMLKSTSDRKTRCRDSQRNTFGLFPGPGVHGTCPGATVGDCGCCAVQPGRKLPTCYVFGIIAAYPATGPALLHNTTLIRHANHTEKVRLLSAEFERFRRIELKQPDPSLFYRLHWSGDIFDHAYAKALAEAMCAFPDITFWNYTRSFDRGVWLAAHTPNLVQYLSIDHVNFNKGINAYIHRPPATEARLQIAYMSATNDYSLRYANARKRYRSWPENPVILTSCPVDERKMPLPGACHKCRKCLEGKAIWFKTR
jgi:hypothetical protein